MFEHLRLTVDDRVDDLGLTVGEALLSRIGSYLHAVYPLVGKGAVKGMAHITGGGITENLPRVLPEGMAARVERGAWAVPPLFDWLQRAGQVPDADMLRTFNMGIGLILVCTPAFADAVIEDLQTRRELPVVIGSIVRGDGAVSYA